MGFGQLVVRFEYGTGASAGVWSWGCIMGY